MSFFLQKCYCVKTGENIMSKFFQGIYIKNLELPVGQRVLDVEDAVFIACSTVEGEELLR